MPHLFFISAMLFSNLLWGKETKLSADSLKDMNIYDFTMTMLDGSEKKLADYKGQILVIVNTASKCGLTPQYESLENFYQAYKDQGVVVLGFPANNFLKQEPGTDEEISAFCEKNYGVSFPMFSKISVKGKNQHPLYQYLTSTTNSNVKWNFQKYIVNRNGEVVGVIPPRQTIDDPASLQLIEGILKEGE